MKRISTTISALLLSACASEPGPMPLSYKERRLAAQPLTTSVDPPPQGVVAPVDRWREALGEQLASPWHLTAIESQVTAPPGWTRFAGDRGLLLTFEDGLSRQSLWVLPRDFEGKVIDPAIAAGVRARGGDLVLWGPKKDALGWDDARTREVAGALSLTANPAGATSVPASAPRKE